MRSRLFSLMVTCLPGIALLLSSTAFGAGAYVGDIEAASLGQGGANIASPETLGAFWYNPAALAGQQGLRAQLEGGFQYTPLTYQRDDGSALVTNSRPYKMAVFGALSYDFGVKDLAVGVAVYSPTAGNYVYPESGAQRYDSIAANNTVLSTHIGVAYRPFSWLSLGVTFGNTYFNTVQRVAVSGALFGDPEDPAFAVPFEIDVTDPFTITSNFGVRFEPLKQLSIGASVAPPYDVQASGIARVTLPGTLSDIASLTGDKVELAVRMPMIVRAGVRYRPIDMLGIEAAFVWQQWSRNDVILVRPVDISVSAPLAMIESLALPEIALTKHYKDSFAARLGVELKPLSLITARAGAFFESSAVRRQRFDIAAPDADKVGITVGASLNVWKLSFDAAYVAILPTRLVVSDSAQTVNTLPVPNAPPPSVIGNGTYNFAYHMVHFGVRASFFDEPKTVAPEEPASATSSPDAPSTIPSP